MEERVAMVRVVVDPGPPLAWKEVTFRSTNNFHPESGYRLWTSSDEVSWVCEQPFVTMSAWEFHMRGASGVAPLGNTYTATLGGDITMNGLSLAIEELDPSDLISLEHELSEMIFEEAS